MSESPETRAVEVEFDDFMSEGDTAMWVGEQDPRMRSTIISVWILDRMPDREDFAEQLVETVAAIPRLRQRVVRDVWQIGPPRWEIDPNFDPRFHLRFLHLGGEGGMRELLDLTEPIAMQAFDKDRPLWEFYLVDGMKDGRAGVIMKLHHAVSDGVGLLDMTASMVEREPGANKLGRRPRALSDLPKSTPKDRDELIRDAIAHRLKVGREKTRRAFAGAADLVTGLVQKPSETLGDAREMLGSVRRLLEPTREPKSPIMRGRGMNFSLNAFVVTVEAMKRTGLAMGGSVNDVFLTALTGGLRRYHEHFGKPVDALNMMMPINLRTDDERGRKAGNQFAPARFLVPVGVEDDQERLQAIQKAVRAQRDESALGYIEDILGVINQLPGSATVKLLEGMTTATDFTASNVRGPRRANYTAGARIEHMYPFGPTAGAGINFTLFSYAGSCHIGINADRAAVSDPTLLLECVQKSFDEMLSRHVVESAPEPGAATPVTPEPSAKAAPQARRKTTPKASGKTGAKTGAGPKTRSKTRSKAGPKTGATARRKAGTRKPGPP